MSSVISNSLHWFCAHCDDKVMKNIRNDRKIEERYAEFLKKFEARVDALEGQITSKVDEKQVREIVENMTTDSIIKAVYSVTCYLLILDIKFLFFKNTVRILKFR